ncbi:hypothetical protein BDZ94DRAFT_1272540 [Collybia nuda]|uniref:F-box domain-containing protein n=1 Tax=Collybia nuda TaxID=64659 RepID=A0A9P6C9Z6_9AGAR|nr:hypothetical protein BDZ94DRAFT_1272540 [Collybia nuda]
MSGPQRYDRVRCLDTVLPVQPPNIRPISVKTLTVQDLPPELIQKIIYFFLEDLPDVTMLPLESGSRHPRLQITHVCSTWRAVSFSIYDFWELAIPGNRSSPGSINLAKSWLLQIPGSRLSLTIMVGGTRGNPSSSLEDLVVPYSHRFRKLSVPVTASELGKLLCLPQSSFCSLEILNLQFIGSEHSINNVGSPFINAPLLRELSLTLDHELQIKAHFPWTQLTKVSVVCSRLDPTDYLSILSNGFSLTHLSLSFISAIDSETETRITTLQSHPLCLPKVKKLHLDFNCSHPGPLLISLELPSLTHLTLGSLSLIHWARVSHRRFFESFASCLEYFETNNSYMFVELDDTILSWMPNLHSLILRRDYRLTSATLQRIGTGELLPKVEHLEFSVRDVSLVVRMLSERQRLSQSLGNPPTSIKKIKVFARTWQVDDEYWKLRAQGVEIQLARI